VLRQVSLALALVATAAITEATARNNLVKIGTGTINPYDRGVSVDVSRANGAFRAVRLHTTSKGSANITRIQILYSDGTSYSHNKKFSLHENERTRELDERRGNRFIDKVIISTTPSSDRAVIKILGLQTRAGRRMKRPAPATGDIAGTATSSSPQTGKPGTIVDGEDVLFGYQNVGFGLDRDVVKVGGDVGKFERIRLRVLGNSIHIKSLKVIYVDGSTQDLAIDARIRANRKTDWFELKGEQFIREIQMIYRSKPSLKGQARVEVTGQFAKDWLGTSGEGRKYNEGWVLLGAQTAGFTGFDRDTITVGKNEGGFTRIRVEAKERPITLREIRIKYYEGPDEVFKMRERVDPGKPYGPLEFKGGKSAIKRIDAKYRSRFNILKGLKKALNGNPAVVEIWAQH
jgi:hypothetical protein